MQLPGLRVLRTRGLDILSQLQLEEVLLRRSTSNYFVLNRDLRAEDAAVVLGFSGKIGELVDVDHMMKNPIGLVRRYTGGGTVVVDKSTLFATFIMNSKDVDSQPYPRDIMAWSEKIYGPVFAKVGGEKGRAFALRENDYVLGDHKIGGNAQTITKARWVHHTSFLWDFDPQMMKYLLLPKKRPLYREDRTHSSFLAPLRHHVPSLSALEEALLDRLKQSFSLEMVALDALQREAKDMLQGLPLETVARSKNEDMQEHLRKEGQLPTLVKQGPSCVNL